MGSKRTNVGSNRQSASHASSPRRNRLSFKIASNWSSVLNNKSTDVVIISAVRTPIGTYKGSLKDLRVDQLGTIVISEVLKRGKISSNLHGSEKEAICKSVNYWDSDYPKSM